MSEPISVECRLDNGRIVPAMPLKEIAASVAEGSTVVVLRKVFPPDVLINVRETVFGWGKRTAMSPSQTYLNDNFHAIERGISPRQKTLHLYHAYNFNSLKQLPSGLSEILLGVFEPLREFYCRLTEREITWTDEQDGARLRPQIIQYPAGGGHFATHRHALMPQATGFVLSLSRRGVDFDTGAVGFENTDGRMIDSSSWHDIGDMILFRFDLRHWVTAVDIEGPLDLASGRGRWVATLPFN